MERVRKRNGFTIVELVIVIVIIGILAAALIPTIGSAVSKAKRTADVTEMKRINVMLLAEEITIAELKAKKLQTSGWELAYSFKRNNVVIVTEVGGEDIIIETDEDAFKDEKASTYSYIRVSLIEDEDIEQGKDPNEQDKDPNDGQEPDEGGSKVPEEGEPKEPDGGPKEPETDTKEWWETEATSLPPKGSEEHKEILAKTEIRIDDKTNFEAGYFLGSKLQRVYLGAGITDIPEDAFSGSKELCEVIFAGQVVTIGDRAFSGCIAIKELVLPETVNSMGPNTFKNCLFTYLEMPCGIEIEDHSSSYNYFHADHLTISGGTMEVSFSNVLHELFVKRSGQTDEPRIKKVTILSSEIGDGCDMFKDDVWKNIEVEMDQETYDTYCNYHASDPKEFLDSIKIIEPNE